MEKNENYRDEMREMLFSLKNIVKDTDNKIIKQKIENQIIDIEQNKIQSTTDNITFIKNTIENVEVSFQKRKKQMLADSEIVKKIDSNLNFFREQENEKVHQLVGTLADEVNVEINNYAKEIVTALNPREIKERFKTKQEFEQWLTIRNENYKNVLNKSIERKVQSVVRKYLDDVDILFETLSKYLDERESYIDVEDEFYGSLALSKKSTLVHTKNTVGELTVYNKTLYEASEDLFIKILKERNKLDHVKKVAGVTGAGAGATLGAATGFGVYAVGTAAVAETAGIGIIAEAGNLAVAATGGVLGIAVGAIAIYALSKGAKKLADNIYGKHLDKNVELFVREFYGSVDQTKGAMQQFLTQNTIEMFEKEQQRIEKSFLELRKVTYIDEKNIPIIEDCVETLKEEIKNYA